MSLHKYDNIGPNHRSSSNPTQNNDLADTANLGKSFYIGCKWINTSTDAEYVCLDNSTGAAVWKETTFGGSNNTVHLSAIGITMDADFSDVSVGTDVSSEVQAILDTAPNYDSLTVVIDGVIKAKDLKLYSNTTIAGTGWNTGIVQAADSRSAIRNYNYRSPYTLGLHDGTIVDKNIIIRDLQIHGNRENASANGLTSGNWLTNENYKKAKEDGELVHPIKIYGCNNLIIENVYIRDPACFHCNLANVHGFNVRRMRFNDSKHANALLVSGSPTGGTFTLTVTDTAGTSATTGSIAYNATSGTIQTAIEALSNVGAGNVTVGSAMGSRFSVVFAEELGRMRVSLGTNSLTGGSSPTIKTGPFNGPNTAGIQIQGPATNGHLDELWGDTSDDFVALNADDWNLITPSVIDSLYGAEGWGGSWDAVWKGDIKGVRITNCDVRTSGALRLLSATSLIDQIEYRDVRGSGSLTCIDTANIIPGIAGSGNMGSIVIDGLEWSALDPDNASALINIESVISSLIIHNVRRSESFRSGKDKIKVASAVNVLVLDGYTIADRTTVNPSHIMTIEAGANVNHLTVGNIHWDRGSQSLAAVAVVAQSGGTVNNLFIRDVLADRVAWVYVKFGGTNTNGVTLSGVTHTNASGNATIALDASQVIARVRTSGVNSALLTSYGAGASITSLVTDGTSDDASASPLSATLPSTYNATASFASTGLSLTLPTAGVYLVTALCRCDQPASSYLKLQFYNSSDSVAVSETFLSQYNTSAGLQLTVPIFAFVTTTGSNKVIQLRAMYVGASGDVITNSDGTTQMFATRLRQ